MTAVRVLITGSREITSRKVVADALTLTFREHGGAPLIVVHGTARGADSIAGVIARDNPQHLAEERHPANWRPDPDNPSKVDRGAGYKRNAAMVALGAEVCLAFLHPEASNRGTRNCMETAAKAGTPVQEFWQQI